MQFMDRLPALHPPFERVQQQLTEAWARYVLSKKETIARMMQDVSCNGYFLHAENDLPEVMDRLCGVTYVPRTHETFERVFASNTHSVIAIVCAEHAKRILPLEEVVAHVRRHARLRLVSGMTPN